MHTRRLVPILLIYLLAACGFRAANDGRAPESGASAGSVAPPLPEAYKSSSLLDFYPDASKRAHESGEVIVNFTVGPNGIAGEPIAVDEQKSVPVPRLRTAARQIVTGMRLPLGDQYKKTLTASIVFEISACGNVHHAKGADYNLNLCLRPTRDPNLSQAQGTVTPSCYGVPYGAQKADSLKSYEVPTSSSSSLPDQPLAPMGEPVKNRLRVQTMPLESPPPEIARIKRGYVRSFVGAFINDGLESWFGVDLDRMEAVSVQRHIYDKRAELTKPFIEPTFTWWDNLSFERKWRDKDRAEMEIVLLQVLDGPQVNAFVCIANKIWERDAPSNDEIPYQSDTISSSSMLFDSKVTDGKTLQSNVMVLPGGPMEAVIAAIDHSMPPLEYKKTLDKPKAAPH